MLWDAVRLSRLREVSLFSNKVVIFVCNWLENVVVSYVPELVLLTTERLCGAGLDVLMWCLQAEAMRLSRA